MINFLIIFYILASGILLYFLLKCTRFYDLFSCLIIGWIFWPFLFIYGIIIVIAKIARK